MKTNEDIADGILDAMNAAGGGTEGWERLEYQGDDRYLGLDAICEVARIVERLIRDGNASPEMIRAAREALLDQELEDERLPAPEEDAPSVEDRVLAGDDDTPADRIAAGVGSAEDLADVIAYAIGAENLRVADIACSILASMMRSGSATLGEDLRNRFAEALRLDWSHPI